MAKRVVRPAVKRVEETSPGDVIELAVTQEVTTKGGKFWAKIGLSSMHRDDESSAEAVERIETFVFTSIDSLIEQVKP